MGWSGPMTHRQFASWSVYLEEEWNRPDRTDHYLMQVGVEVRRVLSREPNSHKLDDMRLEFKRPEPEPDPKTAAGRRRIEELRVEQTKKSQSGWAWLIGKAKRMIRLPDGTRVEKPKDTNGS